MDEPDIAGTERSTNYPVGEGREFILNRWVCTGSRGYRVVPDHDAFGVVFYNAAGSQPVYNGTGLSEDDAHALALRLSGRNAG